MEDGRRITSRMTDSLHAATTKPLKLTTFSTFLLEAHKFILFSYTGKGKGKKTQQTTKIETEAKKHTSPPAGSRTI